ncbi:MAG: NAD(P)-dependent oxidoreductase [Bacteroidota bacterium]
MHHKGRVLITDHVHPVLLNGFKGNGYECDYQPEIQTTQVKAVIHQYHGLIINSKILVDRSMLDSADQLRFIGRLGSGMEIVDLEYAAAKGVAVHSAPEGNRNAVAEHVLGMVLAFANNLLRGDREVRDFVWEREQNRGFEIMGKTIGIYGFGHTGSTLAKKLGSMGVKILAYDKYKTEYSNNMPWVEELTDPDRMFSEIDVLSLHLPLTDETKHLVDSEFLRKFRKKILLVNTSRGAVVKTADLVVSLRENWLLGACLDVFENEKPKTFSEDEQKWFKELYSFDNVVLTPHVAGWTMESKERLSSVLLDKIFNK